MFKLINSETLPVTREMVLAHMEMDPSPTERSLDPSRMKYLREKAEAGQLVTFNWAIAKLGNKSVRMNGQHSSTMLNELNGEFPEGLTAHVDTYEVEKPEDLAILFRQFDARKSSRSSSDVAGAYQGLHQDLADVLKPIAKLAVEGIAYYESHVEGVRKLSGDDQYELFDDTRHHAFIQWMGEVHSIKTPEMKAIPIAAAMYATFSVNEGEARKFWDQVARGGIEFEDEAPSTILDAWLKLAKDSENKRRLKLMPGNLYQGSVYAWNAFREEKQIRDIRYKVEKGLLSPNH